MPFFDLWRVTDLLLSKDDWVDVEQLGCLEASLELSTEMGRANVRLALCSPQTYMDKYKDGPYEQLFHKE